MRLDPADLALDSPQTVSKLVLVQRLSALLAHQPRSPTARRRKTYTAPPSATSQPNPASNSPQAWNVAEKAPSYITRDGPQLGKTHAKAPGVSWNIGVCTTPMSVMTRNSTRKAAASLSRTA